MLIPLMAGVGAYAVYSVLSNRTRLVEQEVERESPVVAPKKLPRDVWTAYIEPKDAVWDVNNEEYTFKVAREGQSLDGRVRQDIQVRHGKAPVAGIY